MSAWLLIVVILGLSVVPASDRPVTGAPHNVEHFAIFALTGLAFGLGYGPHYLRQAACLVVFAGLVEVVQYWVPGRHARLSDFIVDAISACVGLLGASIAIQGLNRFSSIAARGIRSVASPNERTDYAPDGT
jgi:VanZ family protein